MSDPTAGCDGCTDCSMRCTDGIKISESEYTRIVEELHNLDPSRVLRVLEQSKEQNWFEEHRYSACLFLDIDSRLCLVYATRPLICRLFGRVKHLPCPVGKVPADINATRVIQAYASQRLQTFQDWMVTMGVFNFDDLLGQAYQPPRIEI